MSKSLNEFRLIGNLGQNPEGVYLQNGPAVINFSVATTDSWKDKQTGEQKEKTQWHRCKAFGKLAEIMMEYLKKGSKVYLCGKIEYSEFEDKNGGGKRYSTDLIVDDMLMLDSNPNAQKGGFSNQGQQQQAPAQQGGFAPQQQAPAQQGGFAPQQQAPAQQGGFAPQQKPHNG